MNIWIINPYDQTPDQQATRTYEFSKILVERGHNVTIIASSFNHYKFIEEKLNGFELWKDEYYRCVKFTWVRTYPYSKNDWRRSLNMLSHALMALMVGLIRKDKPDIIVGVSVPIFAGLAALILSKIKSSKFIFEVRDLWPETLIDLGILPRDSMVAKVLYRIEKTLYEHAAKIISVLPFAFRYITNLGIPRAKIDWIPNAIDLHTYDHVKEYDGGVEVLRGKINPLQKKFTFIYVGRFGNYQGIDVIIEAARILSQRCVENVEFIMIGDGPERKRVEKLTTSYQLKNVKFRGLLPKRDIPNTIGEADACIAILKNLRVLRYGINPNKLYDYLASGRPIIFAINAENNPVDDAHAGITIPPEDPEQLAMAIERMLAMTPCERKTLGNNGRTFLKNNFEIDMLAKKLENVYIEALT